MDIRPIKTEADYEHALGEIEQLWGAAANTLKGDKLDILLTLVEAYEQAHHPIDPPDPVEAIKFRMEQMGLTRKDLEPYLGKRGRVAEVLNRQRKLSLNMIRRLHTHLHIPLESLIGLSEESSHPAVPALEKPQVGLNRFSGPAPNV